MYHINVILSILLINCLILKVHSVYNYYSACTSTYSLIALQSNIRYRVNNFGDKCTFIIQPPKAKKIRIYVQDLLIVQAEFKITDSVTGRSLFACVSCHSSGNYGRGLSVPSMIESDSNIVRIDISGSPGSGGYSSDDNTFIINYVSVPSENVIGNEILDLGLSMAYDHLTPILVNETTLPKQYKQSWTYPNPGIISLGLGRLSADATKLITFSFESYNFGTDCRANLKIYDNNGGTKLFEGCKDVDFTQKWIYSKTGYFYIVLENNSGSDDTSVNFDLTYYTDKNLYFCGALNNPDILSGSSFILTDGSPSNTAMRSEQNLLFRPCTWNIKPHIQGTVTLYFNWVSLMQGSLIRVYDGSDIKGRLLWDSQVSTSKAEVTDTRVTPPPLTSTGNSLYMIYGTQGGNPNSYFGFNGVFISNTVGSIGIGSSTVTLTMSSAMDLCPPGSGYEYINGLNYTWNIKPTHSLQGSYITFVFSNLSLGAGDILDIYDGNLTRKWTFNASTNTPYVWYKTNLSFAKIHFTSNNDNLSGNFKLSYFTDGSNHHCGFQTNPAKLIAYSSVITDGSRSNEFLYVNQRCEWQISPRDSVGVYLFFTRYNMQGAQIDFYQGNVTGPLLTSITDSDSIPSPIIVKASTVTIVYTSKSFAKGYGFSLTYFGQSDKFVGPGDGLIQVLSSSSIMLSLKAENQSYAIPKQASLKWLFSPVINETSVTRNNVTMYFSFYNFENIDCSLSNITLYDGNDAKGKKLYSYCGNFSYNNYMLSSYRWIETNSTQAYLKFYNNDTMNNKKNFELAYYSDGSNSHCGFTNNPAYLKAPSMIFTDGSSSTSSMYSSQYCEWYISPPIADGNRVLVIDFMEQDLIGANLKIFESQKNGPLLWECNGCRVLPRPIISLSGSVYVTFNTSTTPSVSLGKGFRAVYYTIASKAWLSNIDTKTLELPPNKIMRMDMDNTTLAWKLMASDVVSTLAYYPSVSTTIKTTSVDNVIDGRPKKTFFSPLKTTGKICGFVSGGDSTKLYSSYLKGQDISLSANQYSDSYLRSDDKKSYAMTGTNNLNSNIGVGNFLFEPANTCKYEISSGSDTAVSVKIVNRIPGSGVLKVYAGVHGNGNGADGIPTNNVGAIYDESLGFTDLPDTWIAPCGKATIILGLNNTNTIDYGLEISYVILAGDNGAACAAYRTSLIPVVIEEDPWIKYYIAFGATIGGLILMCCCFCCRVRIRLMANRAFVYNRSIYYSIKKVTPNHPKYTPRLDAFKNRFMSDGMCCICQDPKIKVLRLPCKHGLCVEDIKGYLESALGDISMFPLKCPMHYEGCKGSLGGHVAKRVLNEIQYDKFVEFSDRAAYGEGMRCIFCGNYVNYPANTRYSMVQCPYCIQNFCIRCKKPWHFRNKCPLDTTDESLDSWKNDSGAQKCPACSKLIEKSDVETCNHMVHKITDGIPCIRDRTDFCYLCGEEVSPDYPHEEVNNLGVNHFPDGVFQKCRHVINKEKAEETERLRKLKRKKNAYVAKAQGASITPGDWSNETDEWEDLESTIMMSSMTQENLLERQWVVNSNDDQKSASGSPTAIQPPSTGSPEQVRPGTAGSSNIHARAPPGHNSSRLNPSAPLAGRAIIGGGRIDQRGGRSIGRGRGRF